jgi:ubiquinol-cytochrome c reductase iron-sulfur subunit
MSDQSKKNVDKQPSRRDFLVLASSAVGGVGVLSFAWPFIHSMNPASDVLSLATIDVDLTPIAEGQALTTMWQGKPIFIKHRTAQEIEQARNVSLNDLVHKQTDADRVQKPKWLVVVGICTHLGCVPSGQKVSDNRGNFGGWFCPCHGSEYDTSGRIRRGPAPNNLVVPPYKFLTDTMIRIGQESA